MSKILKTDTDVPNALIGKIELTDKLPSENKNYRTEFVKNNIAHSIFENVMGAILLGTPEGEIIEGNEATCKMFGYSKQELRQLTRKDIVELDENVNKIHSERSKSGSTREIYTCKRKGGELFKAEISSTLFRDELNNEFAFFNITDLSEQGKLVSLLETTSSMGIIGGWDYHIKSQKLIYTRVLKEIIEVPLDFEPTLEFGIGLYKEGENRERVSRLLEDSMKNGSSFDEEFLIITAKGNEKWVRAICKPEIVDGACVGITGTFQDIDKRVNLENELQKIYQAVEQNNISIVITDEKGNIEYVNPAFLELTGYSFNEAIGQNPRILKSGYTTDAEYEKLWNTITSGEKWEGVFYNKKKNGATYWEHAHISPIKNKAGIITNFIAVKENITERKGTEEQIKKLNTELRELSNHLQTIREEERSAIAKEIHDELSQNLVALSMNATYLKNKIKDLSKEDKKILIEQNEIANRLIDISRTIFNSLHPSILDELGLEAAIKWYARIKLKITQIKFEFHTNSVIENEKKSFDIDLAFFRIFQEALTNILHYANATIIKVELYKADKSYSMKISDNGIGFDTNKVDTLLHHGIVGLRERTYAINGKFSIDSVIGKGTSIEIDVSIA